MAGKKVLSIDIGVQTTRMVEIDYKKDKPHIYNVVTFETPDGAVEDGFIRNREILSVAMKEAMVNSGVRNTNVVFSMSSTKIANREVVVPLVPDNKVKGIVDANAKEYFPVDIEQYVVTYTILERLKAEKNMRLLVLAAPNMLIESYYEFAKMMSFDIVALDYVGNSSLQVLKKQSTSSGVTMAVQLNESNTLINISAGDVLMLQRTVPYGTAAVVDAVLQSGEFEVSDRREAWDKLVGTSIVNAKLDEGGIDDAALSYMETNDDSYAQQLRVMKAKEDVTATLNYLVSNVIRVVDYYQSKFPDKKIDKVILCGPGSRINGIANLFRNEMFLEVGILDNIYGVEFERAVMLGNADKCLFMSAIGSAMNPVDFIPKEHLVVAKKKNNDKQMQLAFLGCIGLAAVLAVAGVGKNTVLKGQLKNKQEEAKELEKYEILYNECDAVRKDSENVRGLYISTLNGNSMLNVFFKELEDNFLAGAAQVNSISGNGASYDLDITCANEDMAEAIIMNLKKMSTVKYVYTLSWDRDTSEESETAPEDQNPYLPEDTSLNFVATVELRSDFPYDAITAQIAEGKTFNEAVEESYKVIAENSKDADAKEKTDAQADNKTEK